VIEYTVIHAPSAGAASSGSSHDGRAFDASTDWQRRPEEHGVSPGRRFQSPVAELA